ncbi:MAG TPA: acetate/propionate family kinase [Steroidobacteraceae bacterium]|jgi:acetate kinase|nr:acetate/propionate family kinase [Steroidobacteraceae bacterium]
MSLLTVNVGSSSVRLASFDERDRTLAEQHVDGQELGAAVLLQQFAARARVLPIEAICHRVVHGGERFTAACRIDAAVEAAIEELCELAPLHNPAALTWIRAARGLFPQVPQVAVFDTAFFAGLPPVARSYALPAQLSRQHRLRRYGFHGLAHRYLWQRWEHIRPPGAGGRAISLQLGSGCSVAAVRDGAPLDTSMGLSPLEGLVMATRCGDVDPGLLLYLQRQEGWSADQLEQCLSQRSGLLGVSGESPDMRALLSSGSEAAALALELFCYRARKYIGAYLSVLGGADVILFGGGIGEHLPSVRSRILSGLEWAGVLLDAARNEEAAGGAETRIATADSRIDVRVIPVDESQILLSEARAALK